MGQNLEIIHNVGDLMKGQRIVVTHYRELKQIVHFSFYTDDYPKDKKDIGKWNIKKWKL